MLVGKCRGKVKCLEKNCPYTEFVEANSQAECSIKVTDLAQTHTNIFHHFEVDQYICDYGE